MLRFIRSLLKDKKGVSALEYALLAGLIVVGVGAAISSGNVTARVTTIFSNVGTQLNTAANAGG